LGQHGERKVFVQTKKKGVRRRRETEDLALRTEAGGEARELVRFRGSRQKQQLKIDTKPTGRRPGQSVARTPWEKGGRTTCNDVNKKIAKKGEEEDAVSFSGVHRSPSTTISYHGTRKVPRGNPPPNLGTIKSTTGNCSMEGQTLGVFALFEQKRWGRFPGNKLRKKEKERIPVFGR